MLYNAGPPNSNIRLLGDWWHCRAESMGFPLPGETVLVAAAIYAGTTHDLEILFVVVAAATGSVLGNIVGFWIGRKGGYRFSCVMDIMSD